MTTDLTHDTLVQLLATHHLACPICGYDLHHITAARCPECGRSLALIVTASRLSRAWLALLMPVTVTSGLSLIAGVITLKGYPPRGVFEFRLVRWLLYYGYVTIPAPLAVLAFRRRLQALPPFVQWGLVAFTSSMALLIFLFLLSAIR